MAFGNKKTAAPAGNAAPATPAAPARREKYARAKDVKVGQEANYLRAGSYLVMVNRVEEGQTRKRKDFVSAHVTVLATDNDDRTPLDRTFGGRPHVVGEEASWFVGLDSDYFDQHMLKFAMVASNMTQDEIAAMEDEEGRSVVEAILAEQPFSGVVLEVHAYVKPKKDFRSKDESTLTSNEVSTIVTWKRRLPYAEVKEAVDADVLAKFLPDIDAKIAEEAAA